MSDFFTSMGNQVGKLRAKHEARKASKEMWSAIHNASSDSVRNELIYAWQRETTLR